MKTYNFDAEPFSRAFLERRGLTMNERVAFGMLEAAKFLPISFPDNCLLPTVEERAENGAVGYRFGRGIFIDDGQYERLFAENSEHTGELREIRERMKPFETDYRYRSMCAEADMNLRRVSACWGGGWGGHANPDYDRLLHLGTNGIRRLIEDFRVKNPGKDGFYNAARLAMDSLDIVGGRISALTATRAQTETNRDNKAEYERIAETFRRVPMEPAYDMYSAAMMFWMVYTLDGVDSPGRFDQFMIDFYRASPSPERENIMARLWQAMKNVRAWNLCVSGSDENWNDETNELTYLILDLALRYKYNTPNLTLRVHRNTPDAVWKKATESIATGTGLPALYNDECVCPALEAVGIPPCDSHDYCMNGCNQIDIMGKSHMGLEDGEVNLGKVLDLTLHNGYDFSTGGADLLSCQSGDPRGCKTFEDFLKLFYLQLDYVTDAAIRMANASQEAYARYAPNPLRSCLIQGCLEKGRDYKWGGPLYGHGQILTEGIADTADSLYAVKNLVFDEKRYTMTELIEALENDFVGFERLRHDFASCPKFGNDIPEVDELCAEVVDYFFKYLKTKNTFRGGVYTGGCSTFNRAADNAKKTAALPNGKRNGETTYADSIAATPGRDGKGPTALVLSMLHYDQKQACSGFVAQMKFDKTLFDTEKGRAAFINVAKTYFAGGGQQLSVNVLDRETLLAAQKTPENYQNLIVRVGGYSDYFWRLSKELQQNVIDRTTYAL